MFVSVRDRPQGRRRRSQTYGVNKAARSSKLSLLSAITTQTHGSNDSSSTITQESYSRSMSSKPSRRSSLARSRSLRDGKDKAPPVVKKMPAKGINEKTKSRESVDVFAFLVEEKDQDPVEDPHPEPATLEDDAHHRDESDAESIVRSMHSDSGISMASSFTRYSSDSISRSRPSPLAEHADKTQAHHEAPETQPERRYRFKLKWPNVPEATHKASSSIIGGLPSPEQIPRCLSDTMHNTDEANHQHAESSSGYDLVADKLGSGDLSPVFRSFKKLNYRLLLLLQDEILEMEQQLATLDAADAHSRRRPDGSCSPDSRRLSWQWQQSDLPSHRLHVLGRLSMKLEQYYQVLSGSQRVHRLTSTPSVRDIEDFRTWLRTQNPLEARESRFLDNDEDLILLQGPSKLPATPAPATTLDFVPFCILTMTLLPLLCFKFMSSVLNRLILLVSLLAAGLSSLDKMSGARKEQHRQWVIACCGVSFLVAMLF